MSDDSAFVVADAYDTVKARSSVDPVTSIDITPQYVTSFPSLASVVTLAPDDGTVSVQVPPDSATSGTIAVTSR